VRTLLDTSVVLSPDLIPLEGESAISVATLAELHFGVNLARRHDRRAARLRRLSEVESRFGALPVDSAIARSYGELAHALVVDGRKPRARAMDVLIAATAQTHDVPLLTRDRDFEAFGEHIDVRFV
jgi:predicted nucleic acid-binding protein